MIIASNPSTPLYVTGNNSHDKAINNLNVESAKIYNLGSRQSQQQLTHNPISINGNADFKSQAKLEGWTGAGTVNDPINISDLSISGSGTGFGIVINNTNLNFRIDNVYITSFDSGIYLMLE